MRSQKQGIISQIASGKNTSTSQSLMDHLSQCPVLDAARSILVPVRTKNKQDKSMNRVKKQVQLTLLERYKMRCRVLKVQCENTIDQL